MKTPVINMSQQRVINKIVANFHNVVVTNDEYLLSVTFTNGRTHFLTKTSYMVFIGRRGKVTFQKANHVGSNPEHAKVLASLAAFDLNVHLNYSKHLY